jgi:phospholipid/cholesterol/gamma-HCH transport system substrate-binding protein
MVKRRTEILTGGLAVLVCAAAVATVYLRSPGEAAGLPMDARFQRADGVAAGTQVRLSGLVVGRVVGTQLDEHFRAVVHMRLDPGLAVSADTAAAIYTDGLLGAKYIVLQPGGDEKLLPPGGMIRYTQDSVVIEDLLEAIITEAKRRRSQGATQ